MIKNVVPKTDAPYQLINVIPKPVPQAQVQSQPIRISTDSSNGPQGFPAPQNMQSVYGQPINH
jgi:hypothetical protein